MKWMMPLVALVTLFVSACGSDSTTDAKIDPKTPPAKPVPVDGTYTACQEGVLTTIVISNNGTSYEETKQSFAKKDCSGGNGRLDTSLLATVTITKNAREGFTHKITFQDPTCEYHVSVASNSLKFENDSFVYLRQR